MKLNSLQEMPPKRPSKEKELLNYREDESYIKAQKQFMEFATSTIQRPTFKQNIKDTLPSTSRKNIKSVNSNNSSNLTIGVPKKPIINNKIDLTPTEKYQLSNNKSNDNLNLSLVSQTPSNQICPSNSKLNSFTQILNKNPYSLSNVQTPKLFEMDLFTNSERKIGILATPTTETNKGYSVSQVQKLKIDLAEKQRKNSKSRSNSLARNASMDGNRKKLNDKSFKKKPNNETLKKSEKPIGSYTSTTTGNSSIANPNLNLNGKLLFQNTSTASLPKHKQVSFMENNLYPVTQNIGDAANIIFDQALHNNEKSLAIKVYARFRPFNKVENELTLNGLGTECCLFPQEDVVVLVPDNQVFPMDRVFNPDTSQEKIFEIIGYETILDILNGYNGTIFAYGQTGSGKTHTMFGDIYNHNLAGIIPRSIKQIFNYINNCELDIEYELSCSMLEIYKETLYDLLSMNKADLKIKESPQRGIYVEGLSQISVASQRELLDLLEIGEQTRTVAATRINQYSSRSHTLFMLEIKQRFPNDTEKKGKLNLVDLAGSEKVGKTGAMGETLEEAKKINLSLSCLGNVIHALTTNCDHIPYRDSKLTRLLQESLGGNYKTSLIVTSSSHSSSMEETISTMKFATRAKTIKNHFKMNIKNSHETLQRIIDQLKRELLYSKLEITRLNNLVIINSAPEILEEKTNELDELKESEIANKIYMSNTLTSFPKKIDLTNNSNNEGKTSKNTKNDENSLIDLIQKKEILELRIISQDREISSLNCIITDQNKAIKKHEEIISELKNGTLKYDKKITEVTEEKDIFKIKYENVASNLEMYMKQININKNQIESLKKALLNEEKNNQKLLIEKKNLIDQNIGKNLPKNYEFLQIKLTDYFKESYNFNFEKSMTFTEEEDVEKSSSFISKLDIEKIFSCASQNIKQIIELPSKIEDLLNKSQYTSEYTNLLMNREQITPELTIFLLRQQLLYSLIINQNLERTITALEWKQILEYGKAKIKSETMKIQSKYISNLEKVLEKARISHQQLRNRVETVEYESNALREKIMHSHEKKHDNNNKNDSNSPQKKSRIVKAFGKSSQLVIDPNSYDKKNFALEENKIKLREFLDDFKNRLDSYYQEDEHDEDTDEIFTIVNDFAKFLKENNFDYSGIESLQGESINFNNPSIQEEILRSENSRMQNKILILLSEIELEKCKSEKLQEALTTSYKQISNYKELMEEIERTSREALKQENESWQKISDEIKKISEKELTRKQIELTMLHEKLAEWINKYMELQETKGVIPSKYDKELIDLLKNKENYSVQTVFDMKNIIANAAPLNYKAQNNNNVNFESKLNIHECKNNLDSRNYFNQKNEEIWDKKTFLEKKYIQSKEKPNENFNQKSETKHDSHDNKSYENFGFRYNYNL